MKLTTLSEEILIHILGHLDVSSLAACKQVSSLRSRQSTLGTHCYAYPGQVCRYVSGIINDSARLQYNIELAIAGMEDGCPDGIGPSTAERRQALETYSERWRTLHFAGEIDLAAHHRQSIRYSTSDGYALARISSANFLEVIHFPSRTRHPQVGSRTWAIAGADMADEGIDMGICAIDSARDLLVVVEQRGEQ